MTSFWSDPTIEPKRKNRFIIESNGIPKWICQSFERPRGTTEEVELPYLNSYFYYPAVVKWEPSKLTMVDPISPDAAQLVMDILHGSGYVFPTNENVTKTISKASAVLSLGDIYVHQLGPSELPTQDRIVETWLLHNAFMRDFAFGENAYGDNDKLIYEVTLRFDWPELNPPEIAAENAGRFVGSFAGLI